MAKLYFTYAAMNAGKTTTLLQSSFNYRERGMNTLLYTAAIDTRGGAARIVSRIGLESEARTFTPALDLFSDIRLRREDEAFDCVFVDEAQFLTTLHVDQLARVVDDLNVPVICYGLRTDFRGELFEGSARLLAIADELRELKTICTCGSKATMNLRVNADGAAVLDGESIEIGGNDRYIALCRKHWIERRRKAEGDGFGLTAGQSSTTN